MDLFVREKLEEVTEKIAIAARAVGRDPEQVRLVAVTKGHPPDVVRLAYEAGQRLFGESRVQEARLKVGLLPASVRWDFIGHLQRNKVRQALPMFALFHGLDSLALAREMDRVAGELGVEARVLAEVNLGGEETKHGFREADIEGVFGELLALPRVRVEGVMAIPPPAMDPEAARPYFVRLRELRDRLARAHGVELPELSMGMTSDYEVAVEEGATLVRVGTAIFGPRRLGRVAGGEWG